MGRSSLTLLAGYVDSIDISSERVDKIKEYRPVFVPTLFSSLILLDNLKPVNLFSVDNLNVAHLGNTLYLCNGPQDTRCVYNNLA